MDLVVVCMDDFDVVLGMDFLLEHKVIPMPLAKCLVITDHNPTVILASIKQLGNLRMISAIQLKRGFTREKPTFMAIPLMEEMTTNGTTTEETIPNEIKDVLDSYADIMQRAYHKHYHPIEALITKLNSSPGLNPQRRTHTRWLPLI